LDLHLTDAQATAEERAAVDSDLGVPESGWQGGQRQPADTRAAGNGNVHGRRHRLLPVLHAIQNRIGWISPGALNYLALRLDVAPADVHGVASFYGMFSLEPRPPVVAHVCDDIACVIRGSDKLCAELEGTLGPAASPGSGGRATWLRSQCLGSTWGNPNTVYYQLANTEYGTGGNASCNSTLGNGTSSSCIFYDETLGDMDTDCLPLNGVPYNCYMSNGFLGVLSTSNDSYQPAYGTTTGWDFATGIGSVNAYNLVTNWPTSDHRVGK